MRAGVALSILLLLAAVPAAAAGAGGVRWSAAGEVGAGAGYDSNLFLQVAASPDSPNFHPYAGAFLRFGPALEGAAAGDGYRLALRYAADLVQTFGSGRLALQDGELSLTLPELGPVGVRLAGTVGRFDASAFASDRFTTFGGRAGATMRAGAVLRVSALYEIDRRGFGDPATLMLRSDLGQVMRVRADANLGVALTLGADVEYLRLRSDPVDATLLAGHLDRWRAGAGGSYTPGASVTLAASLWAGTLASDGAETDRQLGVALVSSLRVRDAFDLVARYDLLVDRARGDGSDYTRHVLAVTLVGHLTVPRRRAPAAGAPGAGPGAVGADGDGSDGALAADDGQAPRVERARVRFRVRAAGATQVVVIGSWNDWRAGDPQQRLRRAGGASLWEGWVAVGEGEHRYHFLIDGQPVRPADAPRYRADGFGGQDGVIEVGGAGRAAAGAE